MKKLSIVLTIILVSSTGCDSNGALPLPGSALLIQLDADTLRLISCDSVAIYADDGAPLARLKRTRPDHWTVAATEVGVRVIFSDQPTEAPIWGGISPEISFSTVATGSAQPSNSTSTEGPPVAVCHLVQDHGRWRMVCVMVTPGTVEPTSARHRVSLSFVALS